MSELPIGPPVDATPAQRPGPVVLEGRYGRLEKLGPQHASGALERGARPRSHLDLHVELWAVRGRATFTDWVGSRAALDDPYSYAVDRSVRPRRRHRHVDGHSPGGALGRGRPHRLFAGLAAHAARHRGAISARPLRLRDARQPALRMEMQCAQRRLAPGGAALRFCVRGRAAPALHRQGPQPRHRATIPCSTANGRRARPRSNAGLRPTISMRPAGSGRASPN